MNTSDNEYINHSIKPKKRSNIKQTIRRLVWNQYIGYDKGIGKCWCCNVTQISTFDFECGHVEARSKGGKDTVQNLRPICGLCNRSMGSQNMLDFQKEHGFPKQTSYWNYIKSFVFSS